MIDLAPFYNPDDRRSKIAAPFSGKKYTYATNGHIVIRVPRRADIPASAFAAQCARLFSKHATGRNWFQIPDIPAAIMQPCIYCEPDQLEPCENCHGTLFSERPISVDIGNGYFARKYLALIKPLPNCKISPDGLSAAWFKFNGGNGLLMPMRERAT